MACGRALVCNNSPKCKIKIICVCVCIYIYLYIRRIYFFFRNINLTSQLHRQECVVRHLLVLWHVPFASLGQAVFGLPRVSQPLASCFKTLPTRRHKSIYRISKSLFRCGLGSRRIVTIRIQSNCSS